MYVTVQGKNSKERKHKLSPISKGLYEVRNVLKNTIVIEKTGLSVEKLSQSTDLLTPKYKKGKLRINWNQSP